MNPEFFERIWIQVYALHFDARNEKGASYAHAAQDASRQADMAVNELRKLKLQVGNFQAL